MQVKGACIAKQTLQWTSHVYRDRAGLKNTWRTSEEIWRKKCG